MKLLAFLLTTFVVQGCAAAYMAPAYGLLGFEAYKLFKEDTQCEVVGINIKPSDETIPVPGRSSKENAVLPEPKRK